MPGEHCKTLGSLLVQQHNLDPQPSHADCFVNSGAAAAFLLQRSPERVVQTVCPSPACLTNMPSQVGGNLLLKDCRIKIDWGEGRKHLACREDDQPLSHTTAL